MTFEDAVLNKYYQQQISEIEGLPTGDVTYAPITTENLTTEQLRSQAAAALRPAVDQSIKDLRSAVVSQRAAVDADAASRGMGRSTYVSDVKSRLAQAEQQNVANIESNYGSTLAQRVAEAWNNQANRKATIDMQNESNRIAVAQGNAQRRVQREQTAYERALYFKAVEDALKASSGSGYDPNADGITVTGNGYFADATPRTGAALYIPSSYNGMNIGTGMVPAGQPLGDLIYPKKNP